MKLMTRPPDTKLTPDVARELCQRADSKAYIAGSIASLGSQYVLGLKVVNCQSGDVLAQEQATAAGKEKVLDALGEAASKLRGELGESLPSVQKFDVPLAEATTSSLEALKPTAWASAIWYQKGDAPAIPFFKRAIELDPNFAAAYAVLSGKVRRPRSTVSGAGICHQGLPVARPGQRKRETSNLREFILMPREKSKSKRRPTNCGKRTIHAMPLKLARAWAISTSIWGNATKLSRNIRKGSAGADVVSYTNLGVAYLYSEPAAGSEVHPR